MSSVEDGHRHEIKDSEIKINQNCKPQYPTKVFRDIIIGFADGDNGRQLVYFNIGATIKQSTERSEGLADDVVAGFEWIVVCGFWNIQKRSTDECAFDGIALFYFGILESEVTRIAIGALPVEGKVDFFAACGALKVVKRTQHSEFFAVHFIEGCANA